MAQVIGKAEELLRRAQQRENVELAKIAKQKGCRHEALTPTVVGGFVCDGCGLYLFRKPGG